MDTEDSIGLLAAAPAIAYREYLYRPDGQLAGWIDGRFDVVARPGQHIGQRLQEGDVLLEVALGRISPGRLHHPRGTGPSAHDPGASLAHGQLELWVQDSEHESHVSSRRLEQRHCDVVIDMVIDHGQRRFI
jgi:hypothetical protein